MLTELINGRHNSQVWSSDKFTIPEGVEKTSVCKNWKTVLDRKSWEAGRKHK